MVNIISYLIENTTDVLFHIFIPKSYHMYAILIKKCSSIPVFLFCFRGVVNTSVYLYTEPDGRTIEVKDVRSVAMLLPETIAIKLLSPQMLPKHPFCGSFFTS